MAEAAFLLHTGWSQQQYEEADEGLVLRMMLILAAQADVAKNAQTQ